MTPSIWHIFIQKNQRIEIQGDHVTGYVNIKVNGKSYKQIPFEKFVHDGFHETIEGQRICILSEAEKLAQKIEKERLKRLSKCAVKFSSAV